MENIRAIQEWAQSLDETTWQVILIGVGILVLVLIFKLIKGLLKWSLIGGVVAAILYVLYQLGLFEQ